MNNSLIDKLEAMQEDVLPGCKSAWNAAIKNCIGVIRQHEAQQPTEDVVERVYTAICEFETQYPDFELLGLGRDIARAAIAAMNTMYGGSPATGGFDSHTPDHNMGDASARKDEERELEHRTLVNSPEVPSPATDTLIEKLERANYLCGKSQYETKDILEQIIEELRRQHETAEAQPSEDASKKPENVSISEKCVKELPRTLIGLFQEAYQRKPIPGGLTDSYENGFLDAWHIAEEYLNQREITEDELLRLIRKKCEYYAGQAESILAVVRPYISPKRETVCTSCGHVFDGHYESCKWHVSKQGQSEISGMGWFLPENKCSEMAARTFMDFLALVRHGAKLIDIHVRKDAKEYHFQADILKYMERIRLPMREYKPEIRLEDAIRELWNKEHGKGQGLGNYDEFKAKYPKDCKAHSWEYYLNAATCAAAWKLNPIDIEDGSPS